MKIANEFFAGMVVPVEAVFSADPEVAVAVDQQDVDPGIAEGVGVTFDGQIDREAIAVELVETGLGAEPEKAVVVAGNGQDGVLGETAFDGQGAEEKLRSGLREERGGKESEEEEEKEGEGD